MPAKQNITGCKFGRLTALIDTGARAKKGASLWQCRCACGQFCVVRIDQLNAGRTQSCSCLQRETASEMMRMHGLSKTPTYASWHAMMSRCYNPKAAYFHEYYGGQGITVDPRWADFECFLADMGERPDNTTLDRINGAGHYTPGNCRWATKKQQALNRCNVQVNEQILFQISVALACGMRLCQIAKVLPIKYTTIRSAVRTRIKPFLLTNL
jgi:hypothetical protein